MKRKQTLRKRKRGQIFKAKVQKPACTFTPTPTTTLHLKLLQFQPSILFLLQIGEQI